MFGKPKTVDSAIADVQAKITELELIASDHFAVNDVLCEEIKRLEQSRDHNVAEGTRAMAIAARFKAMVNV